MKHFYLIGILILSTVGYSSAESSGCKRNDGKVQLTPSGSKGMILYGGKSPSSKAWMFLLKYNKNSVYVSSYSSFSEEILTSGVDIQSLKAQLSVFPPGEEITFSDGQSHDNYSGSQSKETIVLERCPPDDLLSEIRKCAEDLNLSFNVSEYVCKTLHPQNKSLDESATRERS